MDVRMPDLDGIAATADLLKATPTTKVMDCEALLSPSVTRRLIERVAAHPILSRKPDPRLVELTTREREVLELIAQGLSNRGAHLGPHA
jgi:DNA-binding NarL/FixJ family response regulator